MSTLKPIKTIRSHAGHARLLAELDQDDAGDLIIVRTIPRGDLAISSPYAYSPEWNVFRWNGRDVVVAETSHCCYQVFAV